MAARKPRKEPPPEATSGPEVAAPEPAAPEPAPPVPEVAEPSGRRLLVLLRRPLVFIPLLVLVGTVTGYTIGAVRLAARETQWDEQRGQLERKAASLETSLQDAQTQEISYRALVSSSRVVVDLYDKNFGLAAEELRNVRTAIESTPRAAGSDLAARLAAFQEELDELSRLVDDMSSSARQTMRDIERQVTALLFPDGS